ncbi:MAG: hypothetical protein M1385_02580 [Candidatus Marsarchaeota archaeon]|nr:hypothetical protein [Candidatus Marsarchaeota archaeon]
MGVPPKNISTAATKQVRQSNGYKPLFELIKESGSPEAAKIKSDIDAIREKRQVLIEQIKRLKKRINYKSSEAETIAKMLQMNQMENDYNEKLRKVRELGKQKRKLEFRISTDTFSLADEKGLVVKINEIDRQMDEAYRVVRFFRKRDFIKKDLEEYNKELSKLNVDIEVFDKQLDERYSELRKILKITHRREHPDNNVRKKREEKPTPIEVNLEDIVVIKKRPKE